MVFIVAALLHPGIQKMAQEELDTVTMRERLPTFEDRPRLPFVDAICKEVIRWRPITPLGELLPKQLTSPTRKCDDGQVYRTQTQEMTSTRVSLSPRVGIAMCKSIRCWLICISGAVVVMNIWCDSCPNISRLTLTLQVL
jgi:hypothetical protein